jgi:hypothetical protein
MVIISARTSDQIVTVARSLGSFGWRRFKKRALKINLHENRIWPMHQHIASEKPRVTSAQKENMKSHASICVRARMMRRARKRQS